MVKKSTPLEKAARMLDLVPYISSHQGIAIADLAAEFGITEEELLSDLNALWMCGDNRFDLIDLEFESGFVSIRNAQTLNVVRSLSKQEIISILLGLDLVRSSIPENRIDIHAEIEAIGKTLGKEMAKSVHAIPVLDGRVGDVLRRAINESKRVRITYYSPAEDEITIREIAPINFSFSDNYGYLLAFCYRAKGERTFRVDRIQDAQLMEGGQEERPDSHIASELETTTICIKRDLRKCREALGGLLEGEGRNVKVSSYSAEWLLRTVISCGGAMEVTSSNLLREEISKRASEILAQYR